MSLYISAVGVGSGGGTLTELTSHPSARIEFSDYVSISSSNCGTLSSTKMHSEATALLTDCVR